MSSSSLASAVVEQPFPAVPEEPEVQLGDLTAIRSLIRSQLVPKVLDVDIKAEYPQDFMRALGAAGGFRGAAAPAFGGNGLGMRHVVEVMEAVSEECLSTGFLVWCQTACARYIQLSGNDELKASILPRILSGEVLAGTGLSNTVKSCDTIEDFRLSARRVEGGYLINGVLPWVSNLGADHVFATGCPVQDEDGKLVFVLVDCDQPGFKLLDCARFIGLDGTRTLACHFKESFVPDDRVLAHPEESDEYVKRIKPGMIHAQMGMGLGLIDACCKLMQQSNKSHSHVNQYLDDQVGDIETVLAGARESVYEIADELSAGTGAERILEILKLRLAGGELSVRAAHAAMLHQGAKGYLVRNPAQRRLREAYFVAIVTPATKHLRREIARIESGERCDGM
ncbi:acyl-CoA dehydrogenase family protein [Nitrogeniibacter aestuarii]|uniref:acyl-CoA dehydrogenase family protein n=1 Tax=Nitrogeniibacter aestuarii TaxID=2815343 RepID=UPI001E5A6F24|nr:acyl-CoA dehydrogenase family protein [Nitrogeniibacter aestuarii]